MDAAELVQGVRRDARLSQVEMAKKAGTSQAAVSAVERRTSDVTVGQAERLLNAAGWELTRRPLEVVDSEDLEMMRLNLTKTPTARLCGYFNAHRLRGLARR